MGNKLYVGNLPYDVNESDLTDLFAKAGKVSTVSVVRDRDTGRGRGFAFVEMATDQDAQNAIAQLHQQIGPDYLAKVVMAAFSAVLDAVSAKMTTDELTKLGVKVGVDNEDLEDVAKQWLTDNGLLS